MRLIVLLCVFAAGAFAGFFLTALVHLTPSDWHFSVGARVLWQLGGGVRGYLTDGSETLKDSIVTWDEGQYRYAIAIYAAEPAAIIKVANSALSCVNK